MANLLNNRYKVIKKLGQNRSNPVFLVEDTTAPDRRRCVVKQLNTTAYSPEKVQQLQARFSQESTKLTAASTGHSQIPNLYGYFEEQGIFYWVREWIEGRPLKDFVASPWSEKQVLAFLSSALKALTHIHRQGIVHLNLKPSNIIVRARDKHPCLMGVGSKALRTIANEKAIMVRTSGFTAPEQTMGKPTLASDVYSLGMMAIYLLTATPPLKIPTDRSNGRLLWQPLAPKTDVRLAGILTRAIHPSANIRFSSAADMLAVLNQMTAASPARPAKIQQPASPKAISPKAVSPKAVSPKAVSPKAVSPQPVAPQSISQQPTVVTPSPVASAATTVEPKPISPTFPPRYARQNAATQTPNNQTPNNQLANPPANAIYNPNASGGLLQQPFLKWWLGLLVASCGVGAIALFGSSFSLNIFSRSAPTIDASSPEVLQETIDELEATVNDAPDNQKASLELVDAYLQGGDVDAADGLIDDMLDVDAANADALYQQGKLLFFQSDYSGAIAALEDALSKNDRHGKAAIMLGRAYQEIGEYNDAREQFESALRMGEKGEAHLNLSYLNHLQGDTQAALDKVEDANRFFKGDEKLKIHTQRSTLYFDLRDRARAQEEWEAAIALSPRNPEGYVLQSISQFFLGDSEGAIANLDQAIAINPNFTEAYTMQSLVHLNQGDLESAAAAIDQAVALDEFSVSTLKIIADVLLSIPEPDLDLALSAMDQALTINPSNPYILNQRCSFMLAVQETETAIDDCTSSIEVNPSNVEAYNTRGQAHLSQLDFASAEADFTHIIEINEAVGRAPDAAAYAQRAAARTGQADTEGAKADLDRALEINSQE